MDPEIATDAPETNCEHDDTTNRRHPAQLNHEMRIKGASEERAIVLVERACALGEKPSCRVAAKIGAD